VRDARSATIVRHVATAGATLESWLARAEFSTSSRPRRTARLHAAALSTGRRLRRWRL
jgi:hypothetical protein